MILIVDDNYAFLTSIGSTVLRGVNVVGLNGVTAIPNLMSKPKGSDLPYFIEVKTGNDPRFTAFQKLVYPLISLGGHAHHSIHAFSKWASRLAFLSLLWTSFLRRPRGQARQSIGGATAT